jgi:hypothetical protein
VHYPIIRSEKQVVALTPLLTRRRAVDFCRCDS